MVSFLAQSKADSTFSWNHSPYVFLFARGFFFHCVMKPFDSLVLRKRTMRIRRVKTSEIFRKIVAYFPLFCGFATGMCLFCLKPLLQESCYQKFYVIKINTNRKQIEPTVYLVRFLWSEACHGQHKQQKDDMHGTAPPPDHLEHLTL